MRITDTLAAMVAMAGFSAGGSGGRPVLPPSPQLTNTFASGNVDVGGMVGSHWSGGANVWIARRHRRSYVAHRRQARTLRNRRLHHGRGR